MNVMNERCHCFATIVLFTLNYNLVIDKGLVLCEKKLLPLLRTFHKTGGGSR